MFVPLCSEPGAEAEVDWGEATAVIAKTPAFLELAGSVVVPASKRGTPWDEVLRRTRANRAGGRP